MPSSLFDFTAYVSTTTISCMGCAEMDVGSFPVTFAASIGAQNRMMMRNSSSLSTDSSEFEFTSASFAELYNEAPVSPKLAKFSRSSWDHSTDDPFMFSDSINTACDQASDTVTPCDHDFTATPSSSAYTEINKPKDDKEEVNTEQSAIHGDDYVHDQKLERSTLRSLFHGDIEQLPSLTNYNKIFCLESKKQISLWQPADDSPSWPWTPSPLSSPSTSSSAASPSSTPADHRNTGSRDVDCHSDDHQKKPSKALRKWAVLKLDFLRKTVPRSRADLRAAEKLRIIRNAGHTHYNASSEEPQLFFESPRESTCSSSNYVCSTESSPRYHNYKDQRCSKSAPMSPVHARTSPETPTWPEGGAAARGGRQVNDKEGSAGKEAMASAGVDQIVNTRPRSQLIRSPHARHYVEQKARAEELNRRTSLPYNRHSLLFGACFFPSHDQSNTGTHINIDQQVR